MSKAAVKSIATSAVAILSSMPHKMSFTTDKTDVSQTKIFSDRQIDKRVIGSVGLDVLAILKEHIFQALYSEMADC